MSDWNMEQFYKGIDLQDKSILDIGCGSGELGQYALSEGAKSMLGLEPMLSGSSETANSKVAPFEILPVMIQDFKIRKKFDLIVLYDSINHLNEEACIRLRSRMWARVKYHVVLSKLYDMLSNGGKIVIADASRRNLFADLGVSNPFDRSIEWHKHQTPELWAELLGNCGFVNPRINWLTPWQLQAFDWLVGNRFVSYCLVSHFRLVMEKP